jgi:hypothetical protein
MRYSILILLLFSSCTFHKKLDGDYYESFGAGWGGANYHFNRNGTFTYAARYDVGGEKGSGNYRIGFCSITFDFTKYDEKRDSARVFLKKRDTALIHHWDLQLTVEDTLKEALIAAMVLFSDSTGKTLSGLTCDMDGHVLFIDTNYRGVIIVKAEYLGYGSCTFTIKEAGAYNVEVLMQEGPALPEVATGTKWKYHLRKITKSKIEWTERFDCGDNEPKTCRRKVTLVRQ